MVARLINWSIKNKMIVIFMYLMMTIYGIYTVIVLIVVPVIYAYVRETELKKHGGLVTGLLAD